MATKEGQLQMSYIKCEEEESLKTLVDCLKWYASTKGDDESVVFVSEDFSREVVTWKELYEKSRLTAKALIKLGVQKDEVVAINVRSCPQWLYLTFGAMLRGARPVGIVYTYTDGSDLVAMMEKLQTCSLLVMDPGMDGANWKIVKDLVEVGSDGKVSSSKMPYLRYLVGYEPGESIHMPDVLSFNDMIKEVPEDISLPVIVENDIAFLFQTSGSTGVPKLVTHTHRSLMYLRYISKGSENTGQFGDRPFPWLGGFPLNVLYGGKRVTLSGFCNIPEDRVKFIIEVVKREENIFVISLMPPILHEFIIRQDELNFDWPIVCISTGGQPMNKKNARCVGKIAKVLANGYGGTEFLFGATAVIVNPDHFQDNLCGTLCNAPGLELKIVNEKDEIVPVNTKGEICIRSPALFKDYYNDPIKTAAVKTPDGWYRTDDVGWLNGDSLLFVEGRKSSMIISGGMNVEPEILERVLESHPSVGSAVIVPVPDEIYHQVLCACIQINPGCDVTEQELRTYFDENTNDKPGMFTVLPKHYMFLTEFPELYTGKTNRKALADKAMKRFADKLE
ncbi:uncharacterized protein LOC123547563 [Mercenaria mercenaria]|uniref:uncharacterized protein LOC123547563 n=1 Tax=Mercenaria mercenaria TaxID=6596 RepID=UPI00234F1F56|nr:uncharacterized protein LOC123547563 [Mercenaria mercenaria]